MVQNNAGYIDQLLTENPIGMAEAAKLFGSFRKGKRCHPSTVVRWCTQGIRLPNGGLLVLEHFRVGGRLMTSRPAVLRFLDAQQTTPTTPNIRTPHQRQQAADKAGDELEKLGV